MKIKIQLKSKNLLGIRELNREEIELILDTAESFKEISTRTIKKVPTLRGRTIVNLFLEPSTRTRTSFELAAKRLSADVVNISGKDSATVKGESLKDTAKTIEAMNADLVIIRHSAAGAPHLLARLVRCGVVNAGDGAHEHPTQALLDLFTIREKLGRIEDLYVAIVGDIAHSRVARSNILAFTKMGAKVTLVAPPTLLPVNIEAFGVDVSYNLDEVIKEVDVVYCLRMQLERQTENLFPSLREYTTLFGLNMARITRARENALIMHPGPMNRGIEITSEVADLPQSVMTDQVTNGVAVRMAILYLLIGGGESV
ncbi:MAG: aspartate carbamoyltransferase catalytic subunit [Actinomycetota bacterium]|nr:aspartate carbamoyltransferase catalytic subunit [Actinomycetota bacterium]MDI6821698.1 aspartate carbamoyltransferase catalytic subunit [Actinomycetota bacterium]